MNLKKNKLYISFHKPVGILGFLISLRTWGKYAHCEFVLNDTVYLSNPGGVRSKSFEYKKYMDLYEVKLDVDVDLFLKIFNELKGKGYDYLAILFSQLLEVDIDDNDKYFCSELCLYMLNKMEDFSWTCNLQSIKENTFSPSKLYKYLKEMELIDEKEVI